jgi:hypothetical protein
LGLEIFENVVVESLVFKIKKEAPKEQNVQIKIQRNRDKSFMEMDYTNVIELFKYFKTDSTFNIYLSSLHELLIDKCKINSLELGNICYCTVGINTGCIKDELTSNIKVDSRYHKMLNGKDISRNFCRVEW